MVGLYCVQPPFYPVIYLLLVRSYLSALCELLWANLYSLSDPNLGFGMGNSIDWSSIVFSIDWSSTSSAWCKRVGKSIDWLSIASLYRLIIDNIFCLMSKGSVKGYNTQAQFGTVAVGIGGGPTELQLWYLDRRHGNLRPSWSRLDEPKKSS